MNKFVKMSLAASVAVAGFASTASAKDLSEAIKDVDISGSIVYRYDDYKSDSNDANKGENAGRNKYKMVVNVASKVNDDVTANVSVLAGNGTSNDMASLSTAQGDENLDIELSQINFDYTAIKNTSIKLGKQGIDTPFTMAVDSDGDTQTGTGIVANTTWYGVTAIAGYFNQTNFDDSASSGASSGADKTSGIYGGEEDVIVAGLASNVGPVALSVWYMGLDDNNNFAKDSSGNSQPLVDASFDAYSLNANYPFALGAVKMNLDARYSNLEFDSASAQSRVGGKTGTTENEFWKLALSGKYGILGASVAYGQTGEDGGYTSIDSSSKATWSGWNADANGVADAEFMLFNVNADIFEKVNLALNHHDIDSDYNDDDDQTDTFAQLTYKMSKNFKTYVRYGQYTGTYGGDEIDSDTGRLQVEYTF